MNRVASAVLILAFPAALTVGIVLIPVVQDYSNHALASDAARDSGRWLFGHLVSAVAFGLGILASFLVLSEAGAQRSAVGLVGLPASAIGGALYAAGLGVDAIGPLAVLQSLGRPDAFFDGSSVMLPAVFMTGTVFWGAGLLAQLRACHSAGLLLRRGAWASRAGALCFIGAPAVPTGWALYLVALGGWAIYLPVTLAILRRKARAVGAHAVREQPPQFTV